jgi:hypothetical protein
MRAVFFVCASLCLSACSTMYVDDINIDAIEVHTGKPPKEIPEWYKNNEKILITIKLSTKRNLRKYSNETRAGLLVESWLCSNKNFRDQILNVNLFEGKTAVQPYNDSHVFASNLKRYEYELFLYTESLPNRDKITYNNERGGKEQKVSFNFLEEPQDVCFRFAGGSYVGKFDSKVLKITAESISDTLRALKS